MNRYRPARLAPEHALLERRAWRVPDRRLAGVLQVQEPSISRWSRIVLATLGWPGDFVACPRSWP